MSIISICNHVILHWMNTAVLQRLSGNGFVGFNNSVFLAEKEVADRNYALAYYMKENKCFPKGTNIKSCLEFWYQVRRRRRIPTSSLLPTTLCYLKRKTTIPSNQLLWCFRSLPCLGLGILHRWTCEIPLELLTKFINKSCEKTGESPVKLFHRSPVIRRCGEFL